jgi:GTP-binding protein YchF
MDEQKTLKAPVSEAEARSLKAGDKVSITGVVYTARDMAHKRLCESIDAGNELPFELEGAIIYFVGPSPARPGRIIGAAGPTTSSRMDAFSPTLIAKGLRAMIGKGYRGDEVRDALKKYGAVHLSTIGGAGALLSKHIVSAEVIAYEDLETEAIRKLQVVDFPAVVAYDTYGNSTIFASLSGKAIPPVGSTTIEEAIVAIPDERLDWLTEYYKPKKTNQATIDCLDLPGFNFTDEHGRAAARRLVNQIRTSDCFVLVVRAFENPAVPPYRNSIDPARDLTELRTEMLLADLELVTTRIEKLEKQVHKPTKIQAQDKAELALHKKLQETIESEKPISSAIETEAEREMIKSLGFLTLKPMAVAVNVGENQLEAKFDFSERVDVSVPVITICAKLEYELAQLDADSRALFCADLGITESATSKFVKSCYSALGLVSFLTVVSNEIRAWPIKQGTSALDAAGKVHTDIKRGFIRAETFSFDELKELGSEKALKAAGKIRLEGKDYIVQDGDVINFRFNV